MSSKILAAVMAVGFFSAGAGVYAYSMLVPAPDLDEPAAVAAPTVTEDAPQTDAPGCCPLSRRSCCH